jgi:hypothetical protein
LKIPVRSIAGTLRALVARPEGNPLGKVKIAGS